MPNKPESPALRLVFAGTPDFAAAALESLLEEGWPVEAVYTQPDRPAGRGQKIRPGPVSKIAQERGIPLEQPLNFKSPESVERLKAYAPDVMVVAAYGLILPATVLAVPRLGCLNIHASLLPRWRGAAPIQRAIEAGDTQSGVGIMQMEESLDTGPVLREEAITLSPEETGGSLHDKLAILGGRLINEALYDVQAERLVAQVQDDSKACYAHKLSRQDGQIDWSADAAQVLLKVRAFNPWPVATTSLAGKPFKIWEAQLAGSGQHSGQKAPGTVLAADSEGVEVACGTGSIRLQRVQLAGSRQLPIADFCNGRPELLKPGVQLGDSE